MATSKTLHKPAHVIHLNKRNYDCEEDGEDEGNDVESKICEHLGEGLLIKELIWVLDLVCFSSSCSSSYLVSIW